jgi:putative oxidoreductase
MTEWKTKPKMQGRLEKLPKTTAERFRSFSMYLHRLLCQNRDIWMKGSIDFLKMAGILSFLTSALHLAIIFGGLEWYRFFGAGENTVIQAEQGSISLVISTLILAAIFTAWGLYAWSGSGVLPRFPFLRTCLILITFVYLARGIIGFVIPFVSNHPRIT